MLELRLIILIVIFSILGGLLSITNAPLRGEEPRRAVVAYESMSNDNDFQPTSFKIPYYNKPPAYNWILSPFFKTFGFSKFVLRLPGLLSLLIFIFFIFRITKEYDFKLGLLSSTIFLTLGDFLFYQSVFAGEIDLIFSSLILALIVDGKKIQMMCFC